ncbi:TPA: hypothetical protein HA235_01430 [Candidatus Woesearchaeota archaeon]|nr:hypothetical protein [Candidatus Woesearchaeota archaeon]HIH31345.1 hypothetical protein [Candidatus Woesearchaeota archaeon]HIH54594.1 hypothetical protein [Candidatus Woesearchaeota archaeon]HIJ02352.1 hypothetical protein [Candidatus Woesearchaeota archaeon]HIJ14170.1 hypothetical protein [Candidatus Woesearchaeota archaeon]
MYITKKRFGKRTYYYIVENKKINGKPVMKHILYLGTAEKILKKLTKRN